MRQREKLPSGFGTIRFLGRGRRRPYAVHPSAVNGRRPPAICYVSEWHVGVGVLLAWNAGQYTRGLEEKISREAAGSRNAGIELDDFCSRLVRYARCFPGNADALLKEGGKAEMNADPACQGESGAETVIGSVRQEESRAEAVIGSARQKKTGTEEFMDPAHQGETEVKDSTEHPLRAGAEADICTGYACAAENMSSGDTSFTPGGAPVREVFERFYAYIFGPNAAKKLSPETAANARSIFRKLAADG